MQITRFLNSVKGKRTVRNLTDSYYKNAWRRHGKEMVIDRSLIPKRLAGDEKLIRDLQNAEEFTPAQIITKTLRKDKEITMERNRIQESYDAQAKRRIWEILGLDQERKEDVQAHNSLIFNPDIRFSLGLPQVSLLTKTVVEDELEKDDQLERLLSSELISDKNHFFKSITERIIMNANVWDTEEVKLPSRFQEEVKSIKLSREILIHPNSTTNMTLRDLVKMTALHLKELSLDLPRKIESDHFIKSNQLMYDREVDTWFSHTSHISNESYRIRLNYSQPIAMISSKAIASGPVAKKDAKEFFQRCTDLIHPIDPALDMVKERVSKGFHHSDGWCLAKDEPLFNNVNLITCNYGYLNSQNNDFLPPEFRPSTQEQRHAVGVMFCYSQALASARRKYGLEHVDNLIATKSDKALDEPITVNMIGSADGITFDFMTFQLNSFTPFGQVPNRVWIDGNHSLFTKVLPKRIRLKYTKYQDLNMSVVARVINMFVKSVM